MNTKDIENMKVRLDAIWNWNTQKTKELKKKKHSKKSPEFETYFLSKLKPKKFLFKNID